MYRDGAKPVTDWRKPVALFGHVPGGRETQGDDDKDKRHSRDLPGFFSGLPLTKPRKWSHFAQNSLTMDRIGHREEEFKHCPWVKRAGV